jgi:hypothetical protein
LSILAYRNIAVVEESLPIWFDRSGDNVTIDTEKVNSFRDINDYQTIPGIFYLFNALTEKGTTTGIISVRGMLFSLCLIHISFLSVITLTSPTLNCSLANYSLSLSLSLQTKGTSSKVEMLIDCQLWLNAFLLQVRSVTCHVNLVSTSTVMVKITFVNWRPLTLPCFVEFNLI